MQHEKVHCCLHFGFFKFISSIMYQHLKRSVFGGFNAGQITFLKEKKKSVLKMSTTIANGNAALPEKEASIPADERNIEIKARVGSDEEFRRRVEIAKQLTKTEGELIVQRDVFFKSQTGRLKLRYLKAPQRSQLVYYDRPDVAGPKLSKFNKIEIDEPETLEKILTQSNGALGILVKHRYLFMHERTRIHLDQVEDLGNFMEFEVCLLPEQTIEEGQAIAEKLIAIFGIKQEDLMTGAYFDEIKK